MSLNWVYPDQSHSLPNVRQHQYLAMEDFFSASFLSAEFAASISRNSGAPMQHPREFEMDKFLGFFGDSGLGEQIGTTSTSYSDIRDIRSSPIASEYQSRYFRNKYDHFWSFFLIDDVIHRRPNVSKKRFTNNSYLTWFWWGKPWWFYRMPKDHWPNLLIVWK